MKYSRYQILQTFRPFPPSILLKIKCSDKLVTIHVITDNERDMISVLTEQLQN